MSPALPTDARSEAASGRGTAVAAALGGAVLVVAYAPTLASYHALWMEQPHTHGYPVAAVAAWLVWQSRGDLRPGALRWSPYGMVATGLALAWAIATAANVRVGVQTALPLLLLAWAGYALRPPAVRLLLPAAAFFLLAVPLWGPLVPPLRLLTVSVSDLALGLLGVPAEIDGMVIRLRYGSFLIEDACAGLNYFMAGVSVGSVYALLFVTGARNRVLAIGGAALTAILANWIRVVSLIVIGDASRMQARMIYDHGRYGWVVFAISIAAYLAVAEWRFRPRSRPFGGASSSAEATDPTGADDGGAIGTPDDPTGPGRLPIARLGAMVLPLVLGPVLYYGTGLLPRRDVDAALPAPSSAWTSVDTAEPAPSAWRPAFEGADEEETRRWSQDGDTVQLDHLVYRSQHQGSELVGFPNGIAPDSLLLAHRMIGPLGPARIYANEAIVGSVGGGRLVRYWYVIGGVETASPLRAKLLEVWAYYGRRGPSELVAVSSACGPETCSAAGERLASFLGGS